MRSGAFDCFYFFFLLLQYALFLISIEVDDLGRAVPRLWGIDVDGVVRAAHLPRAFHRARRGYFLDYTSGNKIVEHCRCIVPNVIND
jgi:hypothetical protein